MASVACPDTDKAVSRTVADESGQKGHDADPSDPVPSGGRKTELKSKCQQKQAHSNSANPVQTSNVRSHTAGVPSFHLVQGAWDMTRAGPQKPLIPHTVC